jgi:hypothetical protein
MSRPVHEVAHIINSVKADLPVIVNNGWKERTLYALSRCRTSAMGGHIDRCDYSECNKLHMSYNSCRNRHCPKCQGHQREEWVQKREEELLNVPYFHVVFTLPDHLNGLCLSKPETLYSMLFKTAWAVIDGFGQNHTFLGAQTGMIAVLHTWGSDMSLHPHLHCIVPAGGVTESGKWKHSKSNGKFLFPVKSMSKVFRAKFLDQLNKSEMLDAGLHEKLTSKPWVVYAKRPFAGPQQVIGYLGRYTHKIAISNHRITEVGSDSVSFTVKDYRNGGKKGTCTLLKTEFIRRFAMHILPRGFVRIRHYGMLSSTGKRKHLESIREQTGKVDLVIDRGPVLLGLCPYCKQGKLVTISVFRDRGPPRHLLEQITKQKASENKQRQGA